MKPQHNATICNQPARNKNDKTQVELYQGNQLINKDTRKLWVYNLFFNLTSENYAL